METFGSAPSAAHHTRETVVDADRAIDASLRVTSLPRGRAIDDDYHYVSPLPASREQKISKIDLDGAGEEGEQGQKQLRWIRKVNRKGMKGRSTKGLKTTCKERGRGRWTSMRVYNELNEEMKRLHERRRKRERKKEGERKGRAKGEGEVDSYICKNSYVRKYIYIHIYIYFIHIYIYVRKLRE